MFCEFCGAQVPDNSTVCPRCKADLSEVIARINQRKKSVPQSTANNIGAALSTDTPEPLSSSETKKKRKKKARHDKGTALPDTGATPPDSPKRKKAERSGKSPKWFIALSVILPIILVAGLFLWINNYLNFFQLGLGLIPAFCVMITVLIIRRAWSVRNVVMTILVMALSGGSIAASFVGQDIKAKSSFKNISTDVAIDMCYALLAESDYVNADKLLSDYTVYGVYTKETALAKSRIEAMRGNYKSALNILEKADPDAPEKKILESLASGDTYDDAITDFKTENPTANTEVSVAEKPEYSHEDLVKCITKEVKKTFPKEYGSAAKKIFEVELAYDEFLKDPSRQPESLNEIRKKLGSLLKKNPELESLHIYRLAQLKADILAGDYKSAVGRLHPDSFYDEYMIASELLINDYVSKRDFNESFFKYSKEEMAAVSKQLEKIRKSYKGKLDEAAYKNLCYRIDTAISKYKDPVTGTLIYGLEDKIAKNEVGGDVSKVQLQIAKIENYCGNEKLARDRISESMASVGMCDDANYVEPMSNLISIASGENREGIKEVAQYVDYVLDNTLPMTIKNPNSGINAGNNSNNDQTDESQTPEFKDLMKEYVVEASAAISIGSINTDNFSKVEARVVFSGDFVNSDVLTNSDIILRDCGIPIENFSMEKIKYSGSEVLLVCDNSGSMSGCIPDLKNAVSSFVGGQASGEEIGLVTFDDRILEDRPFTSDPSTLQSTIDGMSSRGGTNIYGTIIECLSKYSSDNAKNKVMIVMTDGEDGHSGDSEKINKEIGEVAREAGITVYTLGLGNGVNVDYLTTIAQSTGGSFVYASEADELEAFYDFIRNKMNNQYIISYDAVDTLTMQGRYLHVSYSRLPDIYGEKSYNIGSEDTTLFELSDGLSVYGLTPKTIYSSPTDSDIILSGAGFEKQMPLSVKIKGKLSYDIVSEFVDSSQIKLRIPADVLPDSYDLEILINGKRAYLPRELNIINPGSEKEISFGPYKFTASSVATMGNSHVLSGNVAMNGWLHFKGDVTLTGDLEGGSIQMKDSSGSYVEYTAGTSNGLAKIFANRGISLSVPKFSQVTLYNDLDHVNDYENYRADSVRLDPFKIFSVVNIPQLNAYLKPDRVDIEFNAATSILPFQDAVLLYTGEDSPFDISFKENVKGTLTPNNIGINISTDLGDLSEDDNRYRKYASANVSQLPISIDLDGTSAHLNTLDNDYGISVAFKCKQLLGIEGASLSIDWKDLDIDSVTMGIDKKLTCKINTVPITFRNFKISIADLAAQSGDFLTKFKAATFKGILDVEMYNVGETFPKLTEFIMNEDVADMSVLTLPETTLAVNVKDMRFNLNANLKFMNQVELASAEINIGKFNFTKDLLYADGVVAGLQASLKTGIKWDTTNLAVELTGTTEANVHSKFVGLGVKGKAKLDLSLWLIDFDKQVSGESVVGMYMPDGQNPRFVVACKYSGDGGKIKSLMAYIDTEGNCDYSKNYL